MDFNTAKQIAKRILGSTIRRSPDGSGFVVQDKQKQPVESSQITPTEAKKKELIDWLKKPEKNKRKKKQLC